MNFELHMALVETCVVAVWGLCWCNVFVCVFLCVFLMGKSVQNRNHFMNYRAHGEGTVRHLLGPVAIFAASCRCGNSSHTCFGQLALNVRTGSSFPHVWCSCL